jgi:type I restriction enzyme M protein
VNAQTLVAKVWNFAHVLRDQGVSYQAYISQISYLLFLKMDEERVTQIGEASMLPEGARWEDIKDLSGEALNTAYGKLLERLSKQSGAIGAIFLKAQNEIQDPAKLKRLVGLIDSDAKHRTRDLEIPGSPFGRPGMTAPADTLRICDKPCLTKGEVGSHRQMRSR